MSESNLWNVELNLPPQGSLRNLDKAELHDLRERLSTALKRREFLISERGYDCVVTESLKRIERIKAEIAEFLEFRKAFPSEIKSLKTFLDKIDAINASRLEAKSEKSPKSKSPKSKSPSKELLREQVNTYCFTHTDDPNVVMLMHQISQCLMISQINALKDQFYDEFLSTNVLA